MERAQAAENKLTAAKRAQAALEAERSELRAKHQATADAVRALEARLASGGRHAAELEAMLAARERELDGALAAAAAARAESASLEGRLNEAFGKIGELECCVSAAKDEALAWEAERSNLMVRVDSLEQEVIFRTSFLLFFERLCCYFDCRHH